jgi:hypothetical protein
MGDGRVDGDTPICTAVTAGNRGGARRLQVMTPQLSHSSASYDPSPIPRIATLQLFREITLTSTILGISKRVSGKDLRPMRSALD